MVKKIQAGFSTEWKQKLGFHASSFVGRSSDIIIVLMGPTGVGKSTFIKKYTGNEAVVVSDQLESCTRGVTPYLAQIPDGLDSRLSSRRLVLVDTPGFDDTHSDDAEILRRVAAWLADCYNHEMSIGAIVYMHNITDNRMRGSLKTNLNMFIKVCGENAFKKVVLATAHWQKLKEGVGERTEQQLKDKYWSDLLKGGAEVMQIKDTEGEWEGGIIKRCIQRLLAYEAQGEAAVALQIQEEIVDLRKSIPATQAGMELKYTLDEILTLNKKAQANALDEEEKSRLKAKRAQAKKQAKSLKLPLSDRFKKFFGF